MNKFLVVFTATAESDIFRSFEWGQEIWGDEMAELWAVELRDRAFGILSSFPFSQPLAPESALFQFEVRQLILGRYRLLFRVVNDRVEILRLVGACEDE